MLQLFCSQHGAYKWLDTVMYKGARKHDDDQVYMWDRYL